jgi:hypothetical protein
MAKTSAERKAAQRIREALSGVETPDIKMDKQEMDMLRENCVLRRPGREPYDISEYLTMLIRKDNAELKQMIAHQQKRSCRKCGDQLPVTKCPCVGESACWLTLGWHETKLTV